MCCDEFYLMELQHSWVVARILLSRGGDGAFNPKHSGRSMATKQAAMSTRRIFGLIGLGLTIATGYASPITPAFQAPVGGPGVVGWDPNNPVTLGLQFTPQANVSVNALGFYDDPTVAAGETVAIFDSLGHVVVQAAVPTSGPLAYSYFWQSISPVVLNAGEQYTVAAFTGNNGWAWSSAPIVNPAIAYQGQTYHYGSSFTFPQDTANHAADAYYGPNFSIESVPDGGLTAVLLGVGIFGLGFARRKFVA